VIDSSSSVELEEFEQVEAAPGTALLRIAARISGPSVAGAPSTLLVDDGRRVHRVPPLPAPQDPSGVLRAAYPVELGLLQNRPRFSLEFPDGSSIELPSPNRRRRVVRRESPAPHTPSAQTL
jgi:hypothetical protein